VVDAKIIKFPKENVRFDMEAIPTESEELAEKLEDLRKDYFSKVSDEMTDEVTRLIDALHMEDSKLYRGDPSVQDVIAIKESIMAALYTTLGMAHPMHEIMKDNLVRVEPIGEDDDSVAWFYKFKSEA
jgi:hypothetical protein